MLKTKRYKRGRSPKPLAGTVLRNREVFYATRTHLKVVEWARLALAIRHYEEIDYAERLPGVSIIKTVRHERGRGRGRSPKTAKPLTLAGTVLRNREVFYATRELMGGEGSKNEDLNLPIHIEANTRKREVN